MRNYFKKLYKPLAVSGAAAVFALVSTGVANAAAYTWQGYTRDASWNCGPAGSTIPVNGLYLLPCTKTSGASWQAILIVTDGGSQAGIYDDQSDDWGSSSIEGHCQGGTGLTWVPGGDVINPGKSFACFSPTRTNANTWVWGSFTVTVTSASGDVVTKTIDSPLVLTGS